MIIFQSALLLEAKPFINQLGLKQVENEPFAIYQKEDILFIISKMGILNAAQAVSYVQAKFERSKNNLWINIGLAGHPNFPIGLVAMANKISSNYHKKSFYPQLLSEYNIPQAPLRSYQAPNTQYSSSCLCDMEAYGFYHAAQKFAISEKIHVIKVISDNHQNPLIDFKPAQISALIEPKVDEILNLVEKIEQKTHLPDITERVEEASAHISLSQTQKHEVRKKLELLMHEPSQELLLKLKAIHHKEEYLSTINQLLDGVLI